MFLLFFIRLTYNFGNLLPILAIMQQTKVNTRLTLIGSALG